MYLIMQGLLDMRRSARPSQIADLLHKGFIWTCVGLTGYGLVIGGFRVYNYIYVTRPHRQALEKQKLLSEEQSKLKDPEVLQS